MGKETEEERAKRLKRQRSQRELEYELSRDLKSKNDAQKMEEIESQYRNKHVDNAIIFFSTLGLSYLILFILTMLSSFFFGSLLGAISSMFGISLAFITPFIHAAIWIMAIVSVYRGRSVLDDIFHRLV